MADTFRKFFAALSACMVLTVSAPAAQAQVVEGIASGMAVDTLITQVRNALTEVIAQAEVAGTVVSFRVASDAKILLQNLDIMAKELSGKIFSDLNASQQAALNNLLVVSKETTRDLERNITQMDSAIRTMGGEISRIPGVSDRPLLSSYSPSYVMKGEQDFDVVLTGSRLSTSQHSLKVGEETCKAVTSVENQLRYVCPAAAINAPAWVSGNLELLTKRKWYEFWKSDPVYNYAVALKAIPKQMGRYSLEVTRSEAFETFVDRSQNNREGNEHCKGGRDVAWTYTPNAGCTIDISSISVSHNASSKSSYGGTINVGSTGFQTRGRVANNGSCGPFGVPKDGRGSLSVSASWKDRCPARRDVVVAPVEGELLWGIQKSISLPADVSRFVMKVTLANGQERVVTGAGAADWFVTTYDPNSKLLVLRPRELEEALR